jgi:predicted RNA methylase
VHAGNPRTLREDFSGTGALARAWAASASPRRAIAVDSDPAVLKRLLIRGRREGIARRIRISATDATRCRLRADIIAATNFPIGYCHDRSTLLRYVKSVRSSLPRGGIFVCDTYGGKHAMSPLKVSRRMLAPRGQRVKYTWEQRIADPVSSRVIDTLTPLDLTKLRPKVNKTLAKTIHQCLSPLPSNRPPTADAILKALAKVEHEDSA